MLKNKQATTLAWIASGAMLGLAITLWTAPILSQATYAQTHDAINPIAIVTTLTATVGGILAIGSYVVRLTNVINDLKTTLKDDFGKSNSELLSQVVSNREEILKFHSHFQVELVKTESTSIVIGKEFESLQRDFINTQKEVQVIMRQFDRRLQRIEILLKEKEIINLPPDPTINYDIEGL